MLDFITNILKKILLAQGVSKTVKFLMPKVLLEVLMYIISVIVSLAISISLIKNSVIRALDYMWSYLEHEHISFMYICIITSLARVVIISFFLFIVHLGLKKIIAKLSEQDEEEEKSKTGGLVQAFLDGFRAK